MRLNKPDDRKGDARLLRVLVRHMVTKSADVKRIVVRILAILSQEGWAGLKRRLDFKYRRLVAGRTDSRSRLNKMECRCMPASDDRLDIAVVGMPCWTVKQPSHSLAIVGSIVRASGLSHEVHDVNIAFYRSVAEDEKGIWDASVVNSWLGDVSLRLWNKYETQLCERLDRIMQRRPRLLAFTVNMWTRTFSIQAARHVKKIAPETIVMFGGVDCFIGEHNKQFLRDGDCDIICQGEAEISFRKFLSELAEKGWRTTLPGFAYFDEHGELVDTGPVELPTFREPQSSAGVYDVFDLSQYVEPGRVPFFLTRGCPFSCRFCSETVNFSRFRSRDPEEAFAELKELLVHARKYAQVPTIDFSDSIFNANVKNVLKLCELVIANGIEITMAGQGHFHHTMTREAIDTMVRAGFRHIFWGFESGSQKVVDLMKKSFKVSDAVRILEDCSAAGIHQYLPVLVGFPGEEPEDLADTVAFILRYRDLPNLRFFQPSPVLVRQNAELYERYKDFGLSDNDVLRWQSTSGDNTYLVRLARCFVAAQAQGNPALDRAGLICEDYLGFDLNDRAVAMDMFRLIRELYCRGGGEQQFAQRIDEMGKLSAIHGSALQKLWNQFGNIGDRTGDGNLKRWLTMDKNPVVVREVLFSTILEALGRLKAKVTADGMQERNTQCS